MRVGKQVRRGILIIVSAVLLLLGSALPAGAATGFTRSTTGASASVSYSRSGKVYTIKYGVKDTKKDGDCAYINFRPQVMYSFKVPGWNSVGLWGYEKRHKSCGYGHVTSGTDRIDVWSKMSALDHKLATKMRMVISVCRDKSWAHDNCSVYVTSPVSI